MRGPALRQLHRMSHGSRLAGPGMRLGSARGVSKLPRVGRILLLAVAVSICFILGTGSSEAQSTDDHGDAASTATTLSLDSSVAGRIDPGDDLDVFKLDLSGASGNTHVWIYTTGALDTWGGLYDSNGDLLTSNDDTTIGGETETNFRIPWTLSPGVYYVGVFSYDGVTTGDYTLHAKADDHGHFFDTATPLSLGASAAGRIDLGHDRDFFKLDLSATSGTTDVWIYTTGDLDTRGWLYDSSGGPYLVFNGDSYIEGRETNFSLRRNLPRGVYYILIRSWLTADEDYATGDYILHAEAVTDPGNSTGTATFLNLDSPAPGTIDSADDADYFRLALAEFKNLFIYTNGLKLYDGSRYLPIEPLDGTVLDNSGTEISVNIHPMENPTGYRWGFHIRDDFDRGTYYIKVTAPDNDTTYPVPYTIHAYEEIDYPNFIDDCETATVALNNSQISDPLYGCQWHLRNQEQGGKDINVEAVWAEGINGEGVNIAVVDDGMDFTHEDIAANVDRTLNHDYKTGSSDIHGPYEHHGTNVTGVIAARGNDTGVRGVAPMATVYGYNLLTDASRQRSVQDSNLADAMSRNRIVTAVSNNSWAYAGGPGLSDTNQFWELAVDSGIREGYNGKGVFYVFAGGNGGRGHLENPDGGNIDDVGERGDNSNLDEVSNYYAVTAVCAVNDGDARSVYSEKGANLWVCAPSGDGKEHRGIVTIENSDRYMDDFSGTSAAAPIVSGVAALLRQANSDLTWRDLKLILAASARKNDAGNPGWAEGARKYGAGPAADRYHFNHEYGFGMVDAKAAVDLARGWTNVPPLESVTAGSRAAVTIPPPSGSVPQTVTATLTLNTGIRFTEFVEINTDFYHTSFRDMDIELVSPSGAVSKLAVPFNTRYYTREIDGETETYFVRLDGEFRFGSARHLGEDPSGQWTLRLTDHFPELGGTLRSWSIKVYGHVSRPGAPTITTPITAGANSLTLAWSAPDETGGSAIIAYDLRHIESAASDKSDANWTVVEDVWSGSGTLRYILSGLTNGVQYDVQVRAVSAAGDGVWSATVTGTPATTEGAPSVTVTRNAAGPVRTGTPVPVTATFGEPVFGFTIEDIVVANGAVGNLTGGDGDAVYTFDVTPNAVGAVTVDISAGVSADADGNGNTAAPRLLLGIPYDDDGDGAISKDEAIAAVIDYFSDRITKEEAIAVIVLYFSSR